MENDTDTTEDIGVAEFRQIIRNHVERWHSGAHEPDNYGEAVIGQEVGFVRAKWLRDQWQVWDLIDSFKPVGTLPGFIPAPEINFFWSWLKDREEKAEQRGQERGFTDGTAAFQRRLQELCGLNPNKFQPRQDD